MSDTLRKQAEAAAREYLMIPDNYHGEAATAPRYVAVFLKHARPDAALAAENERLREKYEWLKAQDDKILNDDELIRMENEQLKWKLNYLRNVLEEEDCSVRYDDMERDWERFVEKESKTNE